MTQWVGAPDYIARDWKFNSPLSSWENSRLLWPWPNYRVSEDLPQGGIGQPYLTTIKPWERSTYVWNILDGEELL